MGSAIGVTYQVLDKLGRTVAQKAKLKSLRNELPALDPILDEPHPDRMLGYMPVLLSADLERARTKRPVLTVCVLDTLEIVQGLPSERGGLEDLVSRLVYLMPNVAFLAASQLPLGWHDPVRALGLTYGGACPGKVLAVARHTLTSTEPTSVSLVLARDPLQLLPLPGSPRRVAGAAPSRPR